MSEVERTFAIMDIDWWGVISEAIGSAVDVWGTAITANPWPFVGLGLLALVGLVLPATRRRRRF